MLSLSGETATNIAMTLSVRRQNYTENCVKSFEIDLQIESKIDAKPLKFRLQGLSWSPLATPWVVLGCLGRNKAQGLPKFFPPGA